MNKKILNQSSGQAAVLGGTVLGGGGGGPIGLGMEYTELAVKYGQPTMVTLDDLNDDDLIVTVSAVGSPAAKEQFFTPSDTVRAITLLQQKIGKPIAGIIPSENGPYNGINGWLQSAVLNIPVVDAPANGRAHPTGLMGAMGLNRVDNYNSIQAAVGGNPATGKYVELVVEGKLETTAQLVRQGSVSAGGAVVVARDPVTVSYLKENAASGASSQAIEIGNAMLASKEKGPQAVIDSIVETTGGSIFCSGVVSDFKLKTSGGYDVGELVITGDEKIEITFWNEYMTLEANEKRYATFPDLITLISKTSGMPVQTSDLEDGQDVAVLIVPRNNLILGSGVLLPESMHEAEKAVQKRMVNV